MIIRFSLFSKNLSTRQQGTSIREQIITAIENDQDVQFDFQDVFVISNSFADECFGKLLLEIDFEKLKSKTTFRNVDSIKKKTISFALKQRLGQLSY